MSPPVPRAGADPTGTNRRTDPPDEPAHRSPAAPPMAAGGPGAVRGPERRPRGDGTLPGPADPRRERRVRGPDRDRVRRAWLRPVGRRGPGHREFIGFTGLAVPSFEAPFTPAVEFGWRLARPAWGHGYASEAAPAALDAAFTTYGLAEVVSFTSVTNVRSQAVMRRIGMTHDPADDFDPRLPDHRLHRHVLYRISPRNHPEMPPAAIAAAPESRPPVGPHRKGGQRRLQ